MGTTIETSLYGKYAGLRISQAPDIDLRFLAFLAVKHNRKMITIEPIIDFDISTMLHWIEQIQPCMVWLGYDTKKTGLPEPPIEKVKELHWQLSRLGFAVMLKKMRE